MNTTINSFNVTIGSQWNGNGIDAATATASMTIDRQGNSDNNDLTDFAVIATNIGSQNPGLSYPFPSASVSTYSWSPSAGLNCTSCSGTMAAPSQTTTYTVTITDSVCTLSDTITIYVDTTNISVTILNPDTFICVGGNVQMNIAQTGASAYFWSPASALNCTTCPNPVATPSVTTTYYVTAFTPTGVCNSTDTITIYVSALTQATPVSTPNPLCIGSSAQLNVNTSSASSNYCTPAYNTPCSSLDYIDNFTFNTIVNNASGCNGNPDNYIYYSSMSTTAIPGNTYSMSMQSGAAWEQGFGVWIDYNQNGDFNDPGEFVYASPSAATTPFNTTITIPFSALPGTTRLRVVCTYATTITSGQSCFPTFIYGETEDYNVLIGGSQANYTYSWTPTAGLSNPNIGNPIATPTITSTYSITVTDTVAGCSLSGAVTVTVVPMPTASISPSSATICNGQSTSLTASGGGTYLWSPGGQTSATLTTSPATTTIYTVTVTNTDGCTDEDISSVTVNPTPVVSIAGNNSICIGQSTTLTASGGGTYAWSPGGQTNAAVVVSPTANTTYSVTATNTFGCSATSSSTVNIILPPVASFTYSVTGNLFNFTSTSQYAATWSWDFGDTVTSTSQNPFHNYAGAGSYTVTLIVTNPCSSDTVILVVSNLAVSEYESNYLMNVYPNPATDKVTVSIQMLNNMSENGMLIVIDGLGKEIHRYTIPHNNSSFVHPIDFGSMPSGVYLIKVALSDALLTRTVVIQ